MKHLSIAVILLLTVIGSTYANPRSGSDDPYFVGVENFRHQFPNATAVNYKVKGQFTQVNFMWNGMQLQAYYDRQGNPIATARTIDRNSLPVNVQMSLKNTYPNAIITDAIEFTDTEEGLSYYVTAAGPRTTYLLHVSTSGDISVFKKMKH
jgi:hypothetical protein